MVQINNSRDQQHLSLDTCWYVSTEHGIKK